MSQHGRILLVDHSRGAMLFQETILRRRGTSVTTALAGSEGLVKARAERPHLIILGFDLFDMTAPEFCRAIREDALTRGVSLLLVCERENAQHGDLCLAAGCNDVIFRPLQRNDLDAKVARLTTIPARRQLRTITKIEVSLEKDGRFLLARSVNISANGMLLEVDRVLPGEGRVRVHFFLPGDARPGGGVGGGRTRGGPVALGQLRRIQHDERADLPELGTDPSGYLPRGHTGAGHCADPLPALCPLRNGGRVGGDRGGPGHHPALGALRRTRGDTHVRRRRPPVQRTRN